MFRLSFLSRLQVVTPDIWMYSWHCFEVRDLIYVNSSMMGYNIQNKNIEYKITFKIT
jgi:hypothetical protein